MNKFDKVVKKGKRARLSALAQQVEALLRQAGDLAEEIGDPDAGYVFVSNLDKGALTTYMIGHTAHLGAAVAESARRNHGLELIVTNAAVELLNEGRIEVRAASAAPAAAPAAGVVGEGDKLLDLCAKGIAAFRAQAAIESLLDVLKWLVPLVPKTRLDGDAEGAIHAAKFTGEEMVSDLRKKVSAIEKQVVPPLPAAQLLFTLSANN